MKSLLERPRSARESSQEGPVASFTEQGKNLVQHELDRILASHHFLNSKRCQAFLRYAIAETLSGRQDLKERSVGVEVFDRSPSYDTNQDPIVRMTAGEVRKRLALHYQDAVGDSTLRIELPVGTYIPRFHFAAADTAEPSLKSGTSSDTSSNSRFEVEPGMVPVIDLEHGSPAHNFSFGSLKLRALAIASVVLLCAGVVGSRWQRTVTLPKSPIDQLWEPFLTSTSPVFLSIGQIHPTDAEVEPNGLRSSVQGPIALQGAQGYPREIAVTVLGDSVAMTDIVARLRSGGKQVTMRPEADTSFADLQRGPFALVGAFNNDWTIMLTDPLRFHFCINGNESQWICDREHPDDRIGLLILGTPIRAMKSDYAIAARIFDSHTKQMVFIAAGITPFGTEAAGNFLTDPASIAELARNAPKGWSQKNMEILLRTDIIDNEAGPPVVARTAFW